MNQPGGEITGGKIVRKNNAVRPKKIALAKVPASRQTRALDVMRSPKVQRFNRPVKNNQSAKPDLKPTEHPLNLHANARLAARQKADSKTNLNRIQKTATNQPVKNTTEKSPKAKKISFIKKMSNAGLAATLLALILLFSALIWFNLPQISIWLANQKSGLAATFPQTVPDGYALNIPVIAEENQVTMTFLAKDNPQKFKLVQTKSSWDSNAVRQLVNDKSNGQFLTSKDRGLTVYTYDGNAAWVNKGILYKIEGDSDLTNEQILKIAWSL